MTQVAIEFYEPAAAAPGSLAPAPARRRRTRRPYFAMAYWLLAAGLAAYAPFTALYKIDISSADPGLGRQTVDGWGRVNLGPGLDPVGRHATRYGIGFLLVAGLFVLLALAHVRLVPRLAAASRVLAVAAPALLAGIVLVAGLDLESVRDWVRGAAREIAAAGGTQDPAIGLPHLRIGPSAWLGLGAFVAAVVAAALSAMHRTHSAPEPAGPTAQTQDPGDLADIEGIPGSESLG